MQRYNNLSFSPNKSAFFWWKIKIFSFPPFYTVEYSALTPTPQAQGNIATFSLFSFVKRNKCRTFASK